MYDSSFGESMYGTTLLDSLRSGMLTRSDNFKYNLLIRAMFGKSFKRDCEHQ